MVIVMKTQFVETQVDREGISDLMDGRLQAGELSALLPDMASAEARECWHVYHLVGDVLRSSELAACGHDTDFVRRLGERLRDERAPLQPAALPIVVPAGGRAAANDGVFRWKLVAGLASFAAVAAIGWGLMGGIGPQPTGAQLAQGDAVTSGARPMAVANVGATVPPVSMATAEAQAIGVAEAEPVILRDPRLDGFLAAHRQAVGASALAGSAGFLRNATFDGSGR